MLSMPCTPARWREACSPLADFDTPESFEPESLVVELKRSLRRLMRDVRRSVPSDERDRQGALVANLVVGHLVALAAGSIVLSYQSIEGELPTTRLNQRLAERWTVALPRVTANGLEAVVGATQFASRAFGILEPVDGRVVMPADLAAVVVPGVAFTLEGDRLGQGGGFYDRFLPLTTGPTIGVCLREQIVEHIPMAAHDLSVSSVVFAVA
jgi:5-formyltetrahydrofolate cyclo-ligase